MPEPSVLPTRDDSAARPPWLGIFLAVVAAACADAPTRPQALVVAGKTEAALQVTAALPTLPRLVESAVGAAGPALSSDDPLVRAEALWLEAQAESRPPAAAELRESAYRLAVPALAARLGAAAMREAHAALEAWLDTARPVVQQAGLPELIAALGHGRTYLNRARIAQRRGDALGAAEATLRAADQLLATSPRAVGERLLRVGEAALAAEGELLAQRSERRDTLDLQRAERLLRGAREALEEGDYTRAIHRAYYAVQLLE